MSGYAASSVFSGFTPDTGYLNELTPADPAAGANLTVTLQNARWTVLNSVLVTLTTDANAANRFLSVDYLVRGGLAAIRNAATVLVTANTSGQVFQFDNQHAVSEWNTGTMVFAPLLPVPLQAGWQVRLTLDSIQVGDQLSSCKIICTEYYGCDDDSSG